MSINNLIFQLGNIGQQIFAQRQERIDLAQQQQQQQQQQDQQYAFYATQAPGNMLTHRIQSWDFSDFEIPDIRNPNTNLVVKEAKIHNDASVDVSEDGTILVTLIPR